MSVGGFDKRLEFAGEVRGQLDNVLLEPGQIDKRASEVDPEIGKFVSALRPKPGKIYVLNVALGEESGWGTNNNGEFFFDKKKLSDFPQIVARYPSLARYQHGGLLTDHPRYGVKTFVSNPAHVFNFHQNKDVTKAFGRCVFQHFNPTMMRVELIFELDPEKLKQFGARDVLDKLEHDIPVKSSMGCRVPWDMCVSCGNMAQFKREYCSCLRNHMNKIMPDGRRMGALNFLMSFHDMSRVGKNADRSSYFLQKVAQEGCVDGNKKKPGQKKATIVKRIVGLSRMVDLAKAEPRLPVERLRSLKKEAALSEILGASVRSAYVLKPEEFQYLLLENINPGAGEKLAGDGVCFSSSSHIAEITIGSGDGGEDLFSDLLSDRWLSDGPLSDRLLKTATYASSETRFSNGESISAVSSLYNAYVCGIMEQVLTHGPDPEFVKSAAIRPGEPMKLVTPLNLGAGALAYMIASMIQTAKGPTEQQELASSLLSDPKVVGILTVAGMALLRNRLGL